VARAAAGLLGKEFLEVSIADTADAVSKHLFGSREDAERARESGSPPGEIGRTSSNVIYLSDIEAIDRHLLRMLRVLIVRRAYTDALGMDWRVSDDTVLIGGLSSRNSATDFEHLTTSAFDCRIPVEPPKDLSEVFVIASAIAGEFGVVLDEAAENVLQPALQTRDHLDAVRRWLELACIASTGLGRLRESDVSSAIAQDCEWLLERVPYRGRIPSRKRLEDWLQQFPKDIQGIAIDLVRSIAERYYISASTFHEGLGHLIENTRIRRGQPVAFCRWQATGDSAAHMAHLMKTQAGWRNDFELDLNQRQQLWPPVDRSRPYEFIVADDFAGSGGTILKLFDGPIGTLLEAFPTSRLWILVLAGFDHGLREIQRRSKPFGNRLQLHVYRTFSDTDRCFTSATSLIRDHEQQKHFRAFCEFAAREYMPRLSGDFALGYNKSGALVVFYEWVPNNTLPIFWYDCESWHSLFPRSGLI